MKTKFLTTSEAGLLFDPPLSAEMIRYLERVGKLRAYKTERGVRIFIRTNVEKLARERAACRKQAMMGTAKDTLKGKYQ